MVMRVLTSYGSYERRNGYRNNPGEMETEYAHTNIPREGRCAELRKLQDGKADVPHTETVRKDKLMVD